MDVLNFSDTEITLMLFVSAGLALYGFCLTAVLFFAMNESFTWQMEANFITEPSTLQLLLLSPFVKFVRLVEAVSFVVCEFIVQCFVTNRSRKIYRLFEYKPKL